MFTRICFALLLLAAVPLWAQQDDEPQATASPAQMIAPPPISGQSYPTETGAETRSNFLTAGLLVSASYIDNLYPGGNGAVSESMFIIEPSISIDQSNERQHRRFSYNPAFTFYRPSSSLDETDENSDVAWQYRFSPHTSISLDDVFQKSSTAFNGPGGIGVSPSAPASATGVIPPFAQRLSNTATGVFSWRVAERAIIGGSGIDVILHFPDAAEVPGLFNSDTRGGSGFYAHQISDKQFFGTTYQYQDILAYPPGIQTETQTNTIYGFYTYNVATHVSLSVSGGPQHYQLAEGSRTLTAAWGPAAVGSMGWQGLHASFAASYSDSVTGGGGLLGAFHSNTASATGRWQATRNWTAAFGGSYSSNKNVTTGLALSTPGGHTLSGIFSLERRLGRDLRLRGEYDRLHESYTDIAAVTSAPNSDRVMVSLGWQFTRPLGR